MNVRIGTAALLLAVVMPVAASVQVDGVAAYVNAHVITYSDVLGASRDLQQMVALRRVGAEANALYRRVLDELISRKLMLDAYEEQREIKIPDEIVDERVAGMVREMFKGDRTAFLMALAEDGHSEEAWRAQIREQMIVSAMRTLRVDSQVRVSPLAVHARYERDPSLFAEPAAVKFSMIVIARGNDEASRVTQKEKLNTALSALSSGTAFADVARRYSEDVMASAGGMRDWMDADLLRDDLREVVLAAEPETVSAVIEIGPHYSLVKVHGVRAATRIPFEDAYAQIDRELRQEMSQRIHDEWVTRLRRDSFVRVVNENPF